MHYIVSLDDIKILRTKYSKEVLDYLLHDFRNYLESIQEYIPQSYHPKEQLERLNAFCESRRGIYQNEDFMDIDFRKGADFINCNFESFSSKDMLYGNGGFNGSHNPKIQWGIFHGKKPASEKEKYEEALDKEISDLQRYLAIAKKNILNSFNKYDLNKDESQNGCKIGGIRWKNDKDKISFNVELNGEKVAKEDMGEVE